MKKLAEVFAQAKFENRAALIAYIPAGFPSVEGTKKVVKAFIDGGVDIVEIGFPYSDPVMDGPVIQEAANRALSQGTSARDVFETLKVVSDLGAAGVVMTYWNPIERYGVSNFSRDIARYGGSGVITPDLTFEESEEWLSCTERDEIAPIYVIAPSTTDARLPHIAEQCRGFIYAASLMGVTGERNQISSKAPELVARIREVSDLPVCVGLGVSTGEQAREVASYADGVIVGSAFIKKLLDGKDEASALASVRELAQELSRGVRQRR